ncbi:MAG: hypothetical protein V4757_02375 [Pseudomonadota bacterium]
MKADNVRSTVEMLERLEGVISSLNVPVTMLTIADTKEELLKFDQKLTYMSCGQMMLTVSHNLERELKVAKLFALDSSRAPMYDMPEPFGPEVQTAFPSSSFDIAEAARCYALDRPTACVMHVMRALEKPLQLMALDLGHTPTRAAWGDILRDIRPIIAALPNSHPRQEFYSEAAVQFRFIKNAWRDSAMHASVRYANDEALLIFNSCKALLKTLSLHLHE